VAEWIETLAREALLWPSLVYLERLETLEEADGRDALFAGLSAFQGLVILSSAKPMLVDQAPVKGLITVAFGIPPWATRRHAWSRALREQGLRPGRATLDLLAETFPFGRGQIRDSAHAAANLTAYAGGAQGAEPIFQAARSRSGQALARLTVKITPQHDWDDIVLPPETLEELGELCRRVSLHRRVMGEWGFGGKMSGGKGVAALFHGHSGAGKTMAAEVIASELRLDLYKIDLAGVVSKYIGETERNLDRIFDAAADASAILLFDEADALFGKRSEVRDAHDRYANLEVSYLLQKMEQHPGVSILATNLRQNLDEAFLRRLAFTVAFPFPDETSRRRIWEGIWPAETPLAADVDAGWLAARYLLSGGNIRNVALAAAYLAAKDADLVRMSHVLYAVRREFQKMGKTLDASELVSPVAVANGAAA
jgi:SpoVK/Ycf46/Vps4 family AAA+-type ATPase